MAVHDRTALAIIRIAQRLLQILIVQPIRVLITAYIAHETICMAVQHRHDATMAVTTTLRMVIVAMPLLSPHLHQIPQHPIIAPMLSTQVPTSPTHI